MASVPPGPHTPDSTCQGYVATIDEVQDNYPGHEVSRTDGQALRQPLEWEWKGPAEVLQPPGRVASG